MLRTELAELLVHGAEADSIARSFEAKMAETALELEYFEFSMGQHGGEEVRGLRGRSFGGRFTHRGILSSSRVTWRK